MEGYHAYVLNKDGHVVGRHDIMTDNDADAMVRVAAVAASALSDERPAVELWQGSRIVARIPRQAA